MITAQRLEIRDLRSTIETLKQAPVQVDTPPATPALESVSGPANFDAESAPNLEIARLKQMAGVLEAEVGRLTRLRAENATLRTKLAAAATPELTADEAAAMAQAREQALSIRCVNNLKQFGLAVRIWSLDNHDLMPPDMLSLSNELVTPKVLICPADTAHQVARDWASFSRASSSYEFLAPSGSQDESTRVLSRCPIHGHIGLCDGSVQMGAVTNSPAWFHERDGKLYFDQPATLQIIPHNSGK
jgi:hypothetical protein